MFHKTNNSLSVITSSCIPVKTRTVRLKQGKTNNKGIWPLMGSLVEMELSAYKKKWTDGDRQGDSYLPSKNFVCKGYKYEKMSGLLTLFWNTLVT